MASNRLTDVICRSAKYDPDGSKKLFDGGGLFLELMPTGSKKWRLKFRFNGKENRMSFGDYPLVSLAEARRSEEITARRYRSGSAPGGGSASAGYPLGEPLLHHRGRMDRE
ncbi:Arm DNA-binding domain-containing protein [Paraburkholderia sp. Ac-20342]|uniref:Arm DNA-binding domain-containing protein n=1 Tax=Paraburkholderia sp. Ac-20342 TaxID=2703889 RepID=UPI001F121806|nr:Arm DNA-binding domain-containing protein [Paraburkholderia sp. Ac-20342]